MKTATVTTKKGTWTKEENEALMSNVKDYSGTLKNYFEEYSKKTNRPVNNVTQHYYQLIKLNKKDESNNMAQNNEVKKEEKPKVVKAKDIKVKKPIKKAMKTDANITKSSKTTKTPSEMSMLIKNIRKMPSDAISSLSYIVKSMNA